MYVYLHVCMHTCMYVCPRFTAPDAKVFSGVGKEDWQCVFFKHHRQHTRAALSTCHVPLTDTLIDFIFPATAMPLVLPCGREAGGGERFRIFSSRDTTTLSVIQGKNFTPLHYFSGRYSYTSSHTDLGSQHCINLLLTVPHTRCRSHQLYHSNYHSNTPISVSIPDRLYCRLSCVRGE